MNIIFNNPFNKQLVEELKEKYTILELDTVMQPGLPEPIVLHAVVEITNITDLSTLSFFREMHEDMIREYKSGNWTRAAELTSGLVGHFNGELDEFYNLVIDFCGESVKVNRSWDGIKHTVPIE
jgi:hypothetical protein